MRRITLWVVSTLSALVLLLSYRTSTAGTGADEAAAQPAPGTTTSSASPSTSTGAGAEPSASAASEPPSSSSSSSSGTYTGQSADTRWGPVQVRITVTDGRITDVEAVEYPQENHHDVEINSWALPRLQQEVLAAQSAQVDAVSGATVTSDGYLTSLQSAIDQAHL
ncbi:MAG: FMN-binding protein [Quadrisphaera sp.]